MVNLVKNSPAINQTTLSTIGIGSGASSDLVNRLASAGNGMCDMIQNEQLIASVIVKQLKLHKHQRFRKFNLKV